MLGLSKNTSQSGFSLIEISIAIVVLGFVAVFISSTMATQMEQRKALEKQEREDIVRNSIAEFIKLDPSTPGDVVNYPCPADPAAARGDATFGVEQRDASGNCMVFGAIQQVAGTDGKPVFIGAIPTKTLGISDVHAMDVHNKKYLYAVSGDVAATDALRAGNIVNGAIKLVGDSPTITTDYAPFVVISHGENGKGGYSADGTRLGGDCSITDAGDNENCDGDAVFAMRQLVTADTDEQFDDAVTFDIADKRITVENCPLGSIMTGVSKGKPVCEELNLTCPPNQMMVGISGPTPICQNIPVASAPPSLPTGGNPSTPRYVPPTSTRVSSSRPSNNNDEGWLGEIYRETFGRAPDAAGAEYWESQAANGMSIAEIRSHIASSCEAQGTCNTTDAGRQEVAGQANYGTDYETRTGTSASSRATTSASRTTARTDSSTYNTSAKAKSDSAVNDQRIKDLYKQNLGRAPDAQERSFIRTYSIVEKLQLMELPRT